MGLVSGFTFIKNGLTLGYPIRESIESIEPLCDEVVINVGFDDPEMKRDDGTHDYLRSYFNHPKFKFLNSWWDPKKTRGGEILAEQTNIALAQCRGKICQYIQGDEALHEDDLADLHDAYLGLLNHPRAQGLVFNYVHFYGNVDVHKHTRSIYRREVRAIKNGQGIKSWRDAQGFRASNDGKLFCLPTRARVFHYGWARQEKVMQNKVKVMDGLYHGEGYEAPKFRYQRIWGLKRFMGRHPAVMSEWIEKNRNPLDVMGLPLELHWSDLGRMFTDSLEGLTGYRLGEYKNFKLL